MLRVAEREKLAFPTQPTKAPQVQEQVPEKGMSIRAQMQGKVLEK